MEDSEDRRPFSNRRSVEVSGERQRGVCRGAGEGREGGCHTRCRIVESGVPPLMCGGIRCAPSLRDCTAQHSPPSVISLGVGGAGVGRGDGELPARGGESTRRHHTRGAVLEFSGCARTPLPSLPHPENEISRDEMHPYYLLPGRPLRRDHRAGWSATAKVGTGLGVQ